jgi:hypothetical protein
VAEHLDAVELGETGLGDHLQSLSGRVGEEMEMKRIGHQARLWINMGKSLA